MNLGRDRDAAAAAVAPWIPLALLLALLVCSLWITPDVYYHLFLGRRVLETGHPQPADGLLVDQPGFTNIYWAWQLLTYGAFSLGGPAALAFLLVALWLATAWLWGDIAGLFRRPALGLPLALLGILIFQSRLEPRPEALSYLLLALQIRWLQRWEFRRLTLGRQAALLFLTTALWTNAHGYFALAPLLVAARLLSTWRTPAAKAEAGPLAALLGVALAGTVATPFGLGAWREVFTLWKFLRVMRSEVLEFGPPVGAFLSSWAVWVFWSGWTATAIGLFALGLRRQLRPFAALLALPALYLSASAARSMPLLPLLAAPLWRDLLLSLTRRRAPTTTVPRERPSRAPWRWRATRPSLRFLVPAGTGLCALALSAWIVQGGFHRSLRSETRFGLGPAGHAYAIRSAAYLERIDFKGTLFNSAADGGYLEYRLREVRPYIDSRYTDAEPVVAYFRALREPGAFDRLDDQHRFDGVLLKVADSPALVRALLTRPQWRLAQADLHRALFLRKDGPWGDAPSEASRLYQGEDLSERVHGRAAIQWILILRELGRRELLRAALSDLGRAPRLPSSVLQYVLEYALRAGDVELRDEVAVLRGRMVALRDPDREAVDRLLAAPLPRISEPDRARE